MLGLDMFVEAFPLLQGSFTEIATMKAEIDWYVIAVFIGLTFDSLYH